MEPTPTESLARMVRQKRRLLEQLASLGGRQLELIDAGDVGGLVQLLGGKQQLITGLQLVERGLDAFRDDDPETRHWPTPQARAECAADAAECNRLLQSVIATEQQHERRLASRRDDIAVQLRQAQSAHAASTAYKPHLRTGAAPSPQTQSTAGPPTPHLKPTPLSETLDLTAGS